MIEAKPTQYKGVQFRSLLEAQWAAFFDTLTIEWEYEPRKFELPDGKVYIPDFWFPHSIAELAHKGWGFWVEMKPIHREDNDFQVSKLLQICQLTHHNGLLFVGYPIPGQYEVIKYSIGNEQLSPSYGKVCRITTGLSFKPLFDGSWVCDLENDNGVGSYPFGYGLLDNAYSQATCIKADEVNA